jgi:effector-binding domain-containing protein
VMVKRRPAFPIASVRSKVARYSDIEGYEQELLASLPPECVGSTRGVLWHRCADSGSLEGEPFVALKRRAPARSSYDLKSLPFATLACAYAGLDELSSEQAYRALGRWIVARGFSLAGPKREIYLDQALEIQFPMH